MRERAGTVEPMAGDRNRHLSEETGLYSLEKWREREEAFLPCRLRRISSDTLTLMVPIAGEAGDRVVAWFEEFGVIRGVIVRPLGSGFVARLTMDEADKAQFAKKIHWLERRRNHQVPERRGARRVAPRDPRSRLVLRDGSVLACTVVDMSRSGAAVIADLVPGLGAAIILGEVPGRVVRHLESGFAIRFATLLPESELEARLLRPSSGERVYL